MEVNKLYNEDVMEVLKRTPDKSIDLVIGDPDYNVGINYDGEHFSKSWDDYIKWYGALALESLRVLKDSGNIFMINYPRQNAHLWVNYLEKAAYSVKEYVWIYNSNIGQSRNHFTTAHRSILHITKTKSNNFYKEAVAAPYLNPTDKRIKARIEAGHKGRMPYSWVYYNLVKNVSRNKTFHACQLPSGLIELLIKATTKENDTVFILFGGSGGEILLCEKLKRLWLSCELHKPYFDMIEDRLKNGGAIDEIYKLKMKGKENTLPMLL